ncbi:hypothetical protein H310_12319 [Aphanomyces invadans]|uniref:FH2 domain-containing protein n=1 Tax=Aphanomyces invadans TaxID=157072 RepID=A0A024TI59_9STRA|nr:hypothetical protein H310_12319 [Aphanomyces invadans]ETV93743.1 hypothetical protein H310_12319 [Aphanomyces invadans]|eukprot:XP_008877552.1 hypothetical protein H310_12319 [Aphanomyces invadans]
MEMTARTTYDVYEKQRRNVQGWSSELLAGEGANFSEAPDSSKGTMGKDVVSLEVARPPTGYRFQEGSMWVIGDWSYGKSFKHMGTRSRSEQPLDTCRWRKHTRQLDNLTTVEFGREPHCGGCKKAFTLIRRRHHCRGCHVAICKDCSRKAMDTSNLMAKAQWFCLPCLDSNPQLDVQEGGGRRLMRRMSQAPPPMLSRIESMPKTMKFCIECGYELPPHVKFCIDCGAGQTTSRESSADDLLRMSNFLAPDHAQLAGPSAGLTSLVEEIAQPPPSPLVATSPTPTQAEDEALKLENQRLQEMVEKLQRKLARTEAKALAITEEQAHMIATLQQQVQDAHTSAAVAATPATPATGAPSPVAASTGAMLTMKELPEYAKFFKLLSMGLPPEQVKMKMQQAGVDPNVLDTPDAPSGKLAEGAAPIAPASEGHPDYAKYFKLVKMGMPLEQVKLKASADGMDPSMLDGSPPAAPAPIAAPVAEDPPEMAKYKKLLKMGMPLQQVQLKMQAEGLNPALLDGTSSTLPVPNGVTNAPPKQVDLSQILKKSNSVKKPDEPVLPKKESVKPNVDMRALFWTRIPVNVVQSTVWNTLSDTKVPLENFDLEWMFRKNPDATKKPDDDAFKKKKENTAVLLLDSKTQQNVGIAIARFKLSPAEVKAGLLSMDKDAITVDHLSSLIALAPTLEEQDILKNYDGPVDVLGGVEKFFLEMLSIPRYTQRIKCFRFSLQFEHRVLEIQAQVDTLSAATDQIADSTKFRAILETVLAIGNYMNGGTARGGAYGFKLDALAKLHTVRGIDPKVNLMHYLARHLEEHQPDLISFVTEVPHIPEAKRLSLDQIKADINMCNSELTMLQGQVQASKNDSNPLDQFYAKMAPFAREAAEVMDEVTREFAAVESAFTELVGSFGEDARKFGAMDFFSILDEFTTELKKAFRANQSKEFATVWDSTAKAREQAKLAQREKELSEKLSADQAKALYGGVISTLHHRCRELNLDAAAAVDSFKVQSRKYGSGELTATAFCDFIVNTYGAKVALQILPNCAKLLSEPTKRLQLEATVEAKKETWEAALPLFADTTPPVAPPAETDDHHDSLPISSANPVGKLRIKDITPVVGDEARQLQRSILESIHTIFEGDPVQVKLFTANTRKFGNQQMPAKEFYAYLIATFDGDFVARLVPDLARLLDDAEKRHALLQALCESAPGWQRFAGRA